MQWDKRSDGDTSAQEELVCTRSCSSCDQNAYYKLLESADQWHLGMRLLVNLVMLTTSGVRLCTLVAHWMQCQEENIISDLLGM